MVEQSAVNRWVVGSSPTSGASFTSRLATWHLQKLIVSIRFGFIRAPQHVANIACEKGVSDFQYPDFDFGGWIAQSVEQRTENPCVGGSIPSPATTFPRPRHDGAFDDVLHLANVAGPGISSQGIDHIGRDRVDLLVHAPRELFDEVASEHWNVFAAVAQRGRTIGKTLRRK
jgi:hypothetical protein